MRVLAVRHPAAFFVGTVVLVASLVPPLHGAADERFSAHMVQHLLLMLVAAPFLAWGAPIRLTKGLSKPVVVGALHAAAMWLWHLPVFYDAAMGNPMLHVVEHGSFLVTAYLFWVVVIGRSGAGDQLRRVALVFAMTLQSGALGAIIAFASTVLYSSHLDSSAPLTPLEDQQLAGAIMWVPPGMLYLVVMVVLLWSAFRNYEAADQMQTVGER
ncbi:MAG TPA: cytochrome c oxidase assembly protein [Actinomycetota bacterium]|nr:cytochrome c oxidase assembly protein [Actinomycetota bacterium]